jgi:hypothetical protein
MIKSLAFLPMLMLSAQLVLHTQPADAHTEKCVPDTHCPKSQQSLPADQRECCLPPPCEFVQALKFARANYDSMLFNSIMLSGRDGEAAVQDLWILPNFQQFSDLLDQATPCPRNALYEEPPLLSVDEDCEIRYFGSLDDPPALASLEEVRDDVNSCDELVEAKFKQAEVRRQNCLANRNRTREWSLAERIQQDLEDARAELDVLELRKIRYESACTMVPNSEAAQQAIDDDLVPLLPDPKPKAKVKKNKAKRFGKKSGRH